MLNMLRYLLILFFLHNRGADVVSTAIPGGAAAWNASHHLHPKPTKTLANATFNKAFAKVKNGSALGVSVDAIVILRFLLFCS